MNQLAYWNRIYSSQEDILPQDPSTFSTWIKNLFPLLNENLYDWGAGNGRDSFYFAKICNRVVALDQSESAIEKIIKIRNNQGISNLSAQVFDIGMSSHKMIDDFPGSNFHYSRFFLHAIDDSGLRSYFKGLSKICTRGEILAAEYRVQTEKEINYNWSEHQRWLRNPNQVNRVASSWGFELIEQMEGFGLAVYKNEDPYIARQVWKFKGAI